MLNKMFSVATKRNMLWPELLNNVLIVCKIDKRYCLHQNIILK